MGQNEKLVRRIQDGELHLMAKLWKDNQGLVRYIAKRYQEDCGRLFDFADLMQAGYLGLHTAAMIYSAERGASFVTYAVFHIRRTMREVAGLRGKRDTLFDAHSLDAPMGNDDDDTFLDLLPAPCEEYLSSWRRCVELFGMLLTASGTKTPEMPSVQSIGRVNP